MNESKEVAYEWCKKYKVSLNKVIFDSDEPNALLVSLPKYESNLFYLMQFDNIFYNGGLHEYLRGPNGDDYYNVINAAKVVGASSLASSLEAVAHYFPVEVIKGDGYEREDYVWSLAKRKGCDVVDDFIDVKVDDNLYDLIYKFYKINVNDQ
ncbi:hypothetical protein SAMN02745181_0685 [Rubritalea squalenifaciens DSM 18772]|uniref:DNA mimic protein DMP19 C-terminal domain-containing protein n=1 Tax=Rubritalea squalenifaciens DSM 18772 TaxID=1123071 RepID=A0A1M6DA57_9BACT|nr:hypothetical protein [Rubritalea squalenifaciens]SHI70126.1 hypothetical protein SAMN02745181_0685 [Rubritalea squalenifaciens DSM 18772]